MPLQLDGRGYSPLVLEQIVTAGGVAKSYQQASLLLERLAELQVSPRHVTNLTRMIGQELAAGCREQTERYREQPLPRQVTLPETPIELAAVMCDGGRVQTRQAGSGSGVHEPHWRESKNAGFFRMKTQSHASDPHPQLPRCFASRDHLRGLLSGLPEAEESSREPLPEVGQSVDWRPQPLFRTCLCSLDDSDTFG